MNAMPAMPSLTEGVLGWLVVAGGAIATIWVIALSIRWTIWPQEEDPAHPKHLVLRDDR